ncbi:Bacterial regulatory protein, arsR family [Corynebacterium urogenitale]|uniref:Bacterial regulatory protein, arsR family n=1 Tax=Corynebacterium urogenitale TaxID=2487892 RepID=A0A5J6Z359_9CORY|nr:ArsR family transcriptional regulator [Corynebacterium urogenitale]QFQ01498.1 Bacterial regulatory protein, arsR family [Corynebacterium urogenitale]
MRNAEFCARSQVTSARLYSAKRKTMARRVRGYVLSGNRGAADSSSFSGSAGGVGMRERKALATMRRKGGQKAAERWKDRNSEYAQTELSKLRKTHMKKRVQGQTTRARIQTIVGQSFVETGKLPTRKEIMSETGLSEATVKRHLRELRAAGLISD